MRLANLLNDKLGSRAIQEHTRAYEPSPLFVYLMLGFFVAGTIGAAVEWEPVVMLPLISASLLLLIGYLVRRRNDVSLIAVPMTAMVGIAVMCAWLLGPDGGLIGIPVGVGIFVFQWRRWRHRNRSYLNAAAARRYRRRLHR
ncbi:MAG: hypothetical protein OXH23_14195 [bacterium]|nr:hypothetical protein [bacterium]